MAQVGLTEVLSLSFLTHSLVFTVNVVTFGQGQ